ncbi:MAG: hypothetical protein ACLVDL_05140 [Faecalibacterium prausnitzii]
MVPGKAEYDFEPVVIVKIHRDQERVEQLCQELFIFYIPGTEKLKPGDEVIPVDFDPLCFGRVDFG